MKTVRLISNVSRRYARAIFGLALDSGQVEAVFEDMEVLRHGFRSEPDLLRVIEHPGFSWDQKRSLLEAAFGESLGEISRQALFLIVEKGRLDLFEEIAESYEILVDGWRDRIKAQVRSAIPLNDEERGFITKKLEEITGKKHVQLEELVEPELLGGLIVRYGDKQIDGCLKTHLENLREELRNVRVHDLVPPATEEEPPPPQA